MPLNVRISPVTRDARVTGFVRPGIWREEMREAQRAGSHGHSPRAFLQASKADVLSCALLHQRKQSAHFVQERPPASAADARRTQIESGLTVSGL